MSFPGRATLLACACWLVLPMGVTAQQGQIKIESRPYIDQLLKTGWEQAVLEPAPGPISDAEFMRRAYLDIIGQIPRAWEVRVFEEDTSPDKRPRLIDRLLESPDYPRHWAGLWTGWLMNGPVPVPADRQHLRTWLTGELAQGITHKQLTDKLLTATGKPADNPATLYLLSHLGPAVSAAQQVKDGRHEFTPATWRTIQVFLGYGFNCIRCHDHPFAADWKQKHFWQANTYFRQLDGNREQGLSDNPELAKGFQVYPRRNGVFVPITFGVFIDGRKNVAGDGKTRRQILVEMLATHKNFAPAVVNRYWGQFFGRGMNVHPAVDDFGEHNEVVPEVLMARLAGDFAAAGYDYKQLIRWICNSEAYQRSSIINKSNVQREHEPYFSRMLLKELPPAVRLDAVLRALRSEDTMSRQEERLFRERWLRTLVRRPVEDDRDYDKCMEPGGTISDNGVFFEASQMMVHDRNIQGALAHPAGTVAQALKRGEPAKIADELYLAALGRHATARETAWVEKELDKARKDGGDMAGFWQDLFFALLNSTEFIFNR